MQRFIAGFCCLLFATVGCVAPQAGLLDGRAPNWPYPGITAGHHVPAELTGYPLLVGQWLSAFPDGASVLAETSVPSFLMQIAINTDQPGWFLDLGPGAQVENVGFSPSQDRVFLVTAATSPHHSESPVAARAILEIDTRQWVMLRAIPLGRDSYSRGFAMEHHLSRAYLFDEDDQGGATVRVVDLYQEQVLGQRRVGSMPGSVHRKGLVLERDERSLFCLVGGAPADDFAPVGEEQEPPALLALDPKTLDTLARIELPSDLQPRALVYDEVQEKVCVLTGNFERSRIIIVDAGFMKTRSSIDLPEGASDMTLSGGYLFAPGSRGIYIVDLAAETWVSRPGVEFEQTGEIAVGGESRVALVQFHSSFRGIGPGVAVVDLTTGRVLEVLE